MFLLTQPLAVCAPGMQVQLLLIMNPGMQAVQLLEEKQALQVTGQGRQSPEVALRNMLAGQAQVLVVAASRLKSVRQDGQVPFVQLLMHSCGHDCAPITTRRAISAMIILEETIFNIIIYIFEG